MVITPWPELGEFWAPPEVEDFLAVDEAPAEWSGEEDWDFGAGAGLCDCAMAAAAAKAMINKVRIIVGYTFLLDDKGVRESKSL